MKCSIEQKIRVGFGLALAVLLVIGAFSYRSATRFVEALRWEEHTERVLAHLSFTLVSLLNAETASRGYALTGNELFLEPYQPGIIGANESVNELRKSAADNPGQQRKLDVLEPLLARKMRFMSELIDMRKTQGADAAEQKFNTLEGKQVMNEIRKVIGEIETQEKRLLQERSASAQSGANLTRAIAIIGSLLGIVFVGIASIIVHRDFQKRRQAEEERDRFFTLSLDMLCIAGFDGHFKRLNPAWEKTLGFTREELMARPYLDFIHPDDRQATLAEAQKIASGADVISFENRYRCKDGSYRWFLWSATPLVEQQVTYASARDITERKQTEKKVQELNENLESRAAQLAVANKELEAFSYSVSHDLRAPLRHIDGFLELLKKKAGSALDAKCQRYVNMISESAAEMGQLIDDLLSFSRMGRAEMRATRLNLEQLVKDTVNELGRETEGRDIVWKIGALPEVQADPSLMHQVVVNLFSNALKYSRTRARTEIEVGCQPNTNGEHTFFVRDNGVGFDMKFADKLFGVFQRLHEADEFEGTGIGLANVQRIIGRHGGRTWAEGVVDGGATFYFSLPKSQETKL